MLKRDSCAAICRAPKMRLTSALAASALSLGGVQAFPADPQQRPLIFPVHQVSQHVEVDANRRKLHGRFLHITDMHPDPFFKVYAATDGDGRCHRGNGPAGYYGAETSSCDSPFSLVNETLDWIEDNLKDKVDFVVWTGDSARHDNDDDIPRDQHQLTSANRLIAGRMEDIFGRNDRGQTASVIPTFGNNDILPHNIFYPGPNHWTKTYLDIWEPFIPEEQRHTFDIGGYFQVEVIPNKLAVFSLNTLYFFDSNAAVDGCYAHSQPGYKQFMWLKAQLQVMRQRGMKAILSGHVAPARTDSKQNWDETCWQMYTLWTHQFRDVIVGSLYGHMDFDHFMIQDFEDVLLDTAEEKRQSLEDQVSAMGATDYFNELRDAWAELPKVPKTLDVNVDDDEMQANKHKKSKHKKSKDVGGPWAERFSLSFVNPSIIPKFYPTLRIIEYNVTGLEDKSVTPSSALAPTIRGQDDHDHDDVLEELREKKKKKGKHGKAPNIKPPKGPSKTAPPGPAYSPQTFTWLGYKQYFANLTVLNNDFVDAEEVDAQGKWNDGDFVDKAPNKSHKKKPHPKKFGFEVEYDTQDDKIYQLEDMTVKSYVDLARRIGKGGEEVAIEGKVQAEKKGGKKKKKQKKKMAKTWLTFMRRAFVSAVSDEELSDKFGEAQTQGGETEAEGLTYDL